MKPPVSECEVCGRHGRWPFVSAQPLLLDAVWPDRGSPVLRQPPPQRRCSVDRHASASAGADLGAPSGRLSRPPRPGHPVPAHLAVWPPTRSRVGAARHPSAPSARLRLWRGSS